MFFKNKNSSTNSRLIPIARHTVLESFWSHHFLELWLKLNTEISESY